MDAKQIITKESKRCILIWVGGMAAFCLMLAVGFTLAELKWITSDSTSEYKMKMFLHIVKSYWIQAFAAPAVLYLAFALITNHFLRMIDHLTPDEQESYLETFLCFPWYNRMHPGIVYSDQSIYASSFPAFSKTKKISMDEIESVSCSRVRSILVSVNLISGSTVYLTCSKWDVLALYVLLKHGKIPQMSGYIPDKEFEERLSRKGKFAR